MNNTTDTTLAATSQSAVPLVVRSLRVAKGDSLIQVLLFDPQSLINRLAKMEKLEEMTPKKQEPKKQSDAFRTYLYARRHFGTGAGSVPPGTTPPRRPTQSLGGNQPTSSREQERVREVLGQVVASKTMTQLQEEAPGTIVNIVRLLLSCLHAWNLDEALDKSCEEVLGLVRPQKPVSFGILSKGGCMSLVLPGWGLRFKPVLDSQLSFERQGSFCELEITPSSTPKEEGVLLGSPATERRGSPIQRPLLNRVNSLSFTFDQRYHIRWQLSRSLTTQHLLPMVSITNTLMNQSVGAHALASSSGVRKSSMDEDSDSDGEEGMTQRDNIIRAMWSQVAALHCVMLPERMQGRFRPPHLPVLASRFLDPCQAVSYCRRTHSR